MTITTARKGGFEVVALCLCNDDDVPGFSFPTLAFWSVKVTLVFGWHFLLMIFEKKMGVIGVKLSFIWFPKFLRSLFYKKYFFTPMTSRTPTELKLIANDPPNKEELRLFKNCAPKTHPPRGWLSQGGIIIHVGVSLPLMASSTQTPPPRVVTSRSLSLFSVLLRKAITTAVGGFSDTPWLLCFRGKLVTKVLCATAHFWRGFGLVDSCSNFCEGRKGVFQWLVLLEQERNEVSN